MHAAPQPQAITAVLRRPPKPWPWPHRVLRLQRDCKLLLSTDASIHGPQPATLDLGLCRFERRLQQALGNVHSCTDFMRLQWLLHKVVKVLPPPHSLLMMGTCRRLMVGSTASFWSAAACLLLYTASAAHQPYCQQHSKQGQEQGC